MADNDIALRFQTPDAMKSISNILGVAQGVQNIQRGGIALQKERALLQPDIAAGKARSETAQTEAKRAEIARQADVFKLTGDQNARAMTIAGGLFKDPRVRGNDPNAAIEAISEARDTMIQQGVPKATAEWYASQLTSKAHQPGAVFNALQNIVQANAGAQTQAGVLNAPLTPVTTGQNIQMVQTQPGATGAMPAGGTLQTTVPPSGLESVQSDALGNQFVVTRTPQGAIVGTRPLGAAQAPVDTRGPGGAPFRMAPGDAEAIRTLQAERDAARNVALGAGVAHATNRGVIEELQNVAATGVVGPTFQRINSAIGGVLKWGTPEEKASSYDMVGKYLERNALNAAATMGPQTNAYLEAQIKANGAISYNPTAIKRITLFNDAIVSGSEMYQPGLEAAIAASPQEGVLTKRRFDQAWAQNFDPVIFQLRNAQRDGNKEELSALVKSIGGPNSAQAKDIIRRAQNLERLSRDGRL